MSDRAPSAAEDARYEAEARKFDAEREKAFHESRVAKAEADQAELELEKAREKRERERHADDYEHRRYMYAGGVDAAGVAKCKSQLSQWHRHYPGEPLEIVFFSPGGSVFHGLELFDFIRWLSSEGHEVTTTATGFAASMAGVLIQAGDKRVMTRYARIMVHEVASGASGKTSDIEDEVELMKDMQEEIYDIFAERAAQSNAAKPITKARLKRMSTRKDKWFRSNASLEFGLVDEIR